MAEFNVQYKDTIFRRLFNDPQNSLSLYNALNNSNYQDASALTINTLSGGGIFMKYRNDVSFVFCSQLMLVEAQSSVNPNMPLRFLFYISDLLKTMINHRKLYNSSPVHFPLPRFVVLYNGKRDQPPVDTLKISDAFEKSPDLPDLASPEMELKVAVYNINRSKNSGLLEKCRPLYEYEVLVERLREAVSSFSNSEDKCKAATDVIDQCIKENILAEFLKKYRQEVTNMYFWEYNEEEEKAAIEEERQEWRREAEEAKKEVEVLKKKLAEMEAKLKKYECE